MSARHIKNQNATGKNPFWKVHNFLDTTRRVRCRKAHRGGVFHSQQRNWQTYFPAWALSSNDACDIAHKVGIVVSCPEPTRQLPPLSFATGKMHPCSKSAAPKSH